MFIEIKVNFDTERNTFYIIQPSFLLHLEEILLSHTQELHVLEFGLMPSTNLVIFRVRLVCLDWTKTPDLDSQTLQNIIIVQTQRVHILQNRPEL